MLDQIKKTIVLVMNDQSLQETITEETDLINDIGFDSLQLVDFLLEIEKEFGIDINLESLEIDQVRSVRNFIQFIQSHDK